MAKGFVIQPPQPEWGTDTDQDLHVVLVYPEIPGNTGNIGRLCAGTSVWLHLVKPLGFELDNKKLRRAGLDYWPHVKLCVHETWDEIVETFPRDRLHLFSAKHPKSTRHSDAVYAPGHVLIFGRETKGLDAEVREEYADRMRFIPKTEAVRSLNLSNAAAIAIYEAMRQLDWAPMTHSREDTE